MYFYDYYQVCQNYDYYNGGTQFPDCPYKRTVKRTAQRLSHASVRSTTTARRLGARDQFGRNRWR